MNSRQEKYLDNFKKVIQFETISNYENNDVAKMRRFHQEVLKSIFPNIFAKCIVEDFDGSLLIKYEGKNHDKPIMFMNHHDVVEANGNWRYPPFSATVEDGKIYGRGTVDTKSGFYAMLQACEELLSEDFVPQQDVYFESACNEEVTGQGAKAIEEELSRRGIKFNYLFDEGGMIIDEPLKGANGKYAMIGLSERSTMLVEFSAESNGGHASTPSTNTPLVRLGKMMAYFDEHNVFEVNVSDAIVLMFKKMSLSMDKGVNRFVFAHGSLFRPLLKMLMPKISPIAKALVQTTMAFTMASGSNSSNVIPTRAWVRADLRVQAHEGFDTVYAKLKEVAAKFNCEVEIINKGALANVADFNNEGFELASKAINKYFGDDVIVSPYMMNQCTDARYMAPICDNCFRFTPFYISHQQLDSIHGDNENIDIDNLDKAVDFYRFMISNCK